MAVQYIASTDPTLCGSPLKHEGRRQTDRRAGYAGSRLKLIDVSGRSRLKSQPCSRTGENPQSGMLGGIEETAASFEARFAPRSYPTGSDSVDLIRRASSFVDRILRGAKVSELPVEYPTKFELVVNLKTAKAIGLTISESFLLRADEVIE